MQPAIDVQSVSKYYRLGTGGGKYSTLRESLMTAVERPLRRAKRMIMPRGRARVAPEQAAAAGYPAPGTDLWALKDVSLSIKPGESVGIIGRNGAGKSTLLKVLSRITAPTNGCVDIHGRVGSLLEVGTGFHPELTGRENVFLYGAIIGMGRREIARKFDQIVEFSEVGQFIDTPVKRYSSGMYVKLAFSVAAHMEPDILLIDEVLSVGDLAFQRKCMDHARKMLERNVTLLFVSHNMFTIKAMCDRAILLDQGQVRMDGTAEDATQLYDQNSRLDIASWAQNLVGKDPEKCDIHMKDIEVLDEAGRPRSMFNFGERMRVRLHYHARRPVARPNFSLSVQRSDNVWCCNYNSVMDRFDTGTVTGDGCIELLTPPLKLVSELYSVQVLVWDERFQHLYCAQTGKNFHVKDDLLSTEFGVFHEEASWSWHDRTAGA